MNHQILNIFQVVVACLFMASVLLQQKGTGLSSAFGGGGGETNIYRKKRGIEKILFVSSVVLAALFVGGAVVNLFF